MKFNLSFGRGRSGGGSKVDIKQFTLQHIEKIVLGVACLAMLLMLYKGSQSGSDFDSSRTPSDLIAEVSNAEAVVRQPRWDTVYKAQRDRPDRRDLRERAKEALIKVSIDSYPTPMPWKPMIFPPQTKRTDPELLPVRELTARAGYGALAIRDDDTSRTQRWGGDDDSGVVENPTRPLPQLDQVELTENDESISTRSVKGHHFVRLIGVIPFQEQLDQYDSCFRDAAGYSSIRDYPYYFTYQIQRAEVQDENQQVDWTNTELAWKDIEQVEFRELWASRPREMADERHVLQQALFSKETGFQIPPLVRQDLAEWALHPRIPRSKQDTYGESIAEEAMERDRTTEDDPFRRRVGFQRFDGEEGTDENWRNENEGEAGEGYVGDRDPITEFKLFRFFDFTVEPGKSYRYRVRLWLEDPNFPIEGRPTVSPRMLSTEVADRLRPLMQKNATEKDQRDHFRLSQWSEATNVVTVSSGRQILAGSVVPPSTVSLRSSNQRVPKPYDEPVAKVVAMQWDNQRAASIPIEKDMRRGSLGNFTAETEFLRPTDTLLETLTHQFDLNSVVVDIAGGDPLPSANRETLTSPGEVLILNSEGRLIVRNELDDLDAYKQNTFRAPQTSSDPITGSDDYEFEGGVNTTPDDEKL